MVIGNVKIKLIFEFKRLKIIVDTKLNFFLRSEMIKKKMMRNLDVD